MRKLRLYSYMLMLTNVILLAHSFVPHTHHNEVTLYAIEQVAGRGVVDCGCRSCSTFLEILKDSLSQNSCNDNECDGCKHGGENCYISVGYYTDQQNTSFDIDYFYHLSDIFVSYNDTCIEYEYAQLSITIPDDTPVINQDTRGPPSFFA